MLMLACKNGTAPNSDLRDCAGPTQFVFSFGAYAGGEPWAKVHLAQIIVPRHFGKDQVGNRKREIRFELLPVFSNVGSSKLNAPESGGHSRRSRPRKAFTDINPINLQPSEAGIAKWRLVFLILSAVSAWSQTAPLVSV